MKHIFIIIVLGLIAQTTFANWTLEDNLNATCRVSVQGAMGTGSVVNEDDKFYYIMTNGHVVERLGVTCKLEFYKDGDLMPAIPGRVTWLAYNQSDADVAIIVADKSNFQFIPKKLELAPAETDLSQGVMIQGAGCPNGYWFQSWKCRIVRNSGTRVYFQMPPIGGQSGSAITLAGTNKVVGIVTWRLGSNSGDMEGGGVSIRYIQHLMGNSQIKNSFPTVKKPENINFSTPLEPDAIRVSQQLGVSIKDILQGRAYPKGDKHCGFCGLKFNEHVGKKDEDGNLIKDVTGESNGPQLFCPVQCGPGGCNPYFYGSPYQPYNGNPYGGQPYEQPYGQNPYGGQNPQNPQNPYQGNPGSPGLGQGNLPDIFRNPPSDKPPIFPREPKDPQNPQEPKDPEPTPDLKAIEEALDSCRKEKEELQNQINNLKTEKENLDKSINELNSKLQSITEEYNKAKEAHNEQISIFNKTIKSLEEKQDLLIEKYSRAEEDHKIAIEKLEQDKISISAELEKKFQSEIEQYKGQLSDLQQKLEDERKNSGDIGELRQELDNLKTELDSTRNELEKAKDDLNHHNVPIPAPTPESNEQNLFEKLKDKYCTISERIRKMFEGGFIVFALGVVGFFLKKKTGPIGDRLIDWAIARRQRKAILERQKKNEITDNSAYNYIEGDDLLDDNIDEVDTPQAKKKSVVINDPYKDQELSLKDRYSKQHPVEPKIVEEKKEELHYPVVEYKVSFQPKTYVYELLELKQKEGESVQHIAAKGKLYKEAVSLLRQGKLEHTTGNRITNAVAAADAIDDWVGLNFLGKASAAEITILKKDELVREALFGLLYARAIELLRAGELYISVLNNIAIANAIEKHVNNEILKYIRNQEVNNG